MGIFINFKVGNIWERAIARNGGTFGKMMENKIRFNISF
jgi:hypothetical protein